MVSMVSIVSRVTSSYTYYTHLLKREECASYGSVESGGDTGSSSHRYQVASVVVIRKVETDGLREDGGVARGQLRHDVGDDRACMEHCALDHTYHLIMLTILIILIILAILAIHSLSPRCLLSYYILPYVHHTHLAPLY
jgi:hypothetical protein